MPLSPVVTINDNLPRDARQPAADWRERRVADFNRADVTELRLMAPDRTLGREVVVAPPDERARIDAPAGSAPSHAPPTPRSRSLMPRALMLARSANASCVKPAALRWRLSSSPKAGG